MLYLMSGYWDIDHLRINQKIKTWLPLISSNPFIRTLAKM